MNRLNKSTTLFVLFVSCLILSSCTLPLRRASYTPGYVERGTASWYGEDFHGRRTANGEIYNMYGLSAAHRLMPLGTRAKVTNLENGHSVILKVNDRGPFIAGRIIDLSYGAAAELDMVDSGLARVEVEVLKWGDAINDFTVQVGSFVMVENALRLKEQLQHQYPGVHIVTLMTNNKKFYRVRVGSTMKIREAEKLAEELSAAGFAFFITRKD